MDGATGAIISSGVISPQKYKKECCPSNAFAAVLINSESEYRPMDPQQPQARNLPTNLRNAMLGFEGVQRTMFGIDFDIHWATF